MLTDIRALADHFLIALPNINRVVMDDGEEDEELGHADIIAQC